MVLNFGFTSVESFETGCWYFVALLLLLSLLIVVQLSTVSVRLQAMVHMLTWLIIT